ncbi:MAG: hypothetical protein ACRCXD_00760 [Luteolibacter sp.]
MNDRRPNPGAEIEAMIDSIRGDDAQSFARRKTGGAAGGHSGGKKRPITGHQNFRV